MWLTNQMGYPSSQRLEETRRKDGITTFAVLNCDDRLGALFPPQTKTTGAFLFSTVMLLMNFGDVTDFL